MGKYIFGQNADLEGEKPSSMQPDDKSTIKTKQAAVRIAKDD